MKPFYQYLVCASLLLPLCGCAVQGARSVIRQGEAVDLGFTCRQQNGETVASSDLGATENKALVKSPLFRAKVSNSPIIVSAGAQAGEADAERAPLGYEMEIVARLCGRLPGLSFGEHRNLEIDAVAAETRKGEPQAINYALVRVRPKELRMTPEEYEKQFGAKAKLGVKYSYDPVLPAGVLTSITDKEVLFSFHADAGSQVPTPFGTGTVRETADNYQIVIDAKKGALVRLGNQVGRISEVGAETFSADFSHPFGGEKLFCDLTLAPVQAAKNE